MSRKFAACTRAVRAGIGSDSHHGAVVPPIHLSSNFTFEGHDQKGQYDYSRSGNPTRDHLGHALASLEGGAGCVVTSSGMSAIALVLQLLQPGDLLIAPHDCYGGTYRAFAALSSRGLFEVAFVDQNDAPALDALLQRRPKMIWAETPSNPLLRIVDLRSLAAAAHRVGALLVADNTFLSPILQRPLELGADIVLHSTTKYLNGHSDVVGGAVIAKDVAVQEQLDYWGNCLGLTGSPFDSYLTLRGLRSLHVRMRAHQENAQAVVAVLCSDPEVGRVYYPGLPDHPGHRLAESQQDGYGAMISFEMTGGESAVGRCLDGLRCFSLAESLGVVESLVAHPATMTHSAMDPEARRRAGISDALLRLSVGIEDPDDLCRDLQLGLARAYPATCRQDP